jgi:hypothetical protein
MDDIRSQKPMDGYNGPASMPWPRYLMDAMTRRSNRVTP